MSLGMVLDSEAHGANMDMGPMNLVVWGAKQMTNITWTDFKQPEDYRDAIPHPHVTFITSHVASAIRYQIRGGSFH